jgi:hypothetical protein
MIIRLRQFDMDNVAKVVRNIVAGAHNQHVAFDADPFMGRGKPCIGWFSHIDYSPQVVPFTALFAS